MAQALCDPLETKILFLRATPKWGLYFDFIQFVAYTIIKKEKETKIVQATGAENSLNKYSSLININKAVIKFIS